MQISMSLVPEFETLYDECCNDPRMLQVMEIEGISPKQLDPGLASHDFFERRLADISTDSNANMVNSESPITYRMHTTNGQMKLLGYHQLWYYTMKRYGLENANEWIKMLWDGSLYFHDAHSTKMQMPYCFAFSLDKIVYEGRPYGSSPNTPPKHRRSFISQVDKLISDLSKQFAGATAPSDFFLWYAYYCKQEGMNTWDPSDRTEMIQDFQSLVCLFNDESRTEGDPPFTNIAIYDQTGLESLFNHIVYPDFTKPDFNYIMGIQKLFCEWFSQGDPITGFPYKFPVVTINITTDDKNNFVHEGFARWAAATNRLMGNFNLHFGSRSKLAMCCRYENDLDDMDMGPDSFGNGGVNIGSHRVVTVNFPRAAILADGDTAKFYEILDHYFDVASKLLIVHRYDILESRIKKNPGFLKFFGQLRWFNLKTMFSTFGVTGVYEVNELMGYDILDDDGTEFTLDLMAYIKSKVKEYRRRYNIAFNAEEIPGEQACVSLLKKDKIMTSDHMLPYELYSNQYIPLIKPADMVTRIDLSGRFMRMISGGGIVHLNSDARIDTDGKMFALMKLCAKSGVPHVAVCYRYGRCTDHTAYIIGQSKVCPICGKPIVQARARVIGYFSDEYNWHPVRREHDAPLRYYSNGRELLSDDE